MSTDSEDAHTKWSDVISMITLEVNYASSGPPWCIKGAYSKCILGRGYRCHYPRLEA